MEPLEHIRFIIEFLFNNKPDGVHFLSDFPHVFVGVLLENLGIVGDDLERLVCTRALLMSLVFWPEIVLVL